jgi:hypothetical protein
MNSSEAGARETGRTVAPASGPGQGDVVTKVIPGAAERPAFAAGFPSDPELDRLLEYFVRGNHRAVRDGAVALEGRATDPEVKKAARELRDRLEPDPIWRVLLGTTLVLLMVLTWWASRRSRELRGGLNGPPPTIAPTVQTIVK